MVEIFYDSLSLVHGIEPPLNQRLSKGLDRAGDNGLKAALEFSRDLLVGQIEGYAPGRVPASLRIDLKRIDSALSKLDT